MLISRDYKVKLVDKAIDRARTIPREKALERVTKEKEKGRPVFSIEYHPALPSISHILKKHWRVMVDDPYLKDIFPKPPMVAYRRPKNLKEKLVRAKVPPVLSRPKRNLPGMKRCPYNCLTCPYVLPDKKVKASATNYTHEIEASVNCQTQNVIYCINCNKCKEQYIGETEKTLSIRFSQHRGYVNCHKVEKATGEHFNQPGHKLNNMNVTILEKVYSNDPFMRKTRESHYIKKMNTKYKGMNRKL